MKIGLVCPYNISKGGGVQEVVKALQHGLILRGHEAVIITPRPRAKGQPPKGTIFLGNGADFKSPMATTAQFSMSVDGKEIDEMLEREKFDVLHFHEPWQPVLCRQIITRSSCVNVATFHANLPGTMMSRTVIRAVIPYTKPILKYIHSYTAVSEAALEHLRIVSDHPVSIIPNGIDLHHYHSPRQRPENKEKIILYVGRLEKRKGVKYLLQAFAALREKKPDVRLIIAGDGVDRQKLEQYVEEEEIKNVEFLGYVTEHDKRELLRKADLFCSPALYGESFGIVLLEAMASGLVTVAGNNAGYASVLQGLGALSLVNPHDTHEFAKRLDLLLHEPELRKLWLKWAKDNVVQYSYPHVVEQYEDVYRAALQNHASEIHAQKA
jgi:phosphatidylinositol alpha-mannosyltransferase